MGTQHIAGIGFSSLSPDMVEEVSHLASQRQGLMLNAQDLNLGLRMSLFNSPNPQNALLALFPEQGLAEGFCDSVQVYGDLVTRAKAQPHVLDASIAQQEVPAVIAFTAAGRQQRDVQAYVLQVEFEGADEVGLKTRLVDRLVAGQDGSKRIALEDVKANGLFILKNRDTVPVEHNLGPALKRKTEGPAPLFYEVASLRAAAYCINELQFMRLGTGSHWPRL